MVVKKECYYEEGYLINSRTGEVNKTKYKTEVYEDTVVPPVYVKCVACGLTAFDGDDTEYEKKINELAKRIFGLKESSK